MRSASCCPTAESDNHLKLRVPAIFSVRQSAVDFEILDKIARRPFWVCAARMSTDLTWSRAMSDASHWDLARAALFLRN